MGNAIPTPALSDFKTAQEQFAIDVAVVLGEVEQMLLAKNRKYGDAALNPKRIFSKASPSELIKVRLDDKISRIAADQADEDEDPYWDMLGYLVLFRIAKMREAEAIALNERRS